MIRHVVLFKWNEGVDGAHIAATKAALDRLPSLIPEIVNYYTGPDLDAVPGTWDYAVTADFVSMDDFFVYREHSDHQEVVRSYFGDFCERLAVQFQFNFE